MADQVPNSRPIIERPSKKHAPNYRRWISQELEQIADLMPEQVTTNRILATIEELVDIEPERLDKAFARVRQELKFFPKPVEILERLPTKRYGIFADDDDELLRQKPM